MTNEMGELARDHKYLRVEIRCLRYSYQLKEPFNPVELTPSSPGVSDQYSTLSK